MLRIGRSRGLRPARLRRAVLLLSSVRARTWRRLGSTVLQAIACDRMLCTGCGRWASAPEE
eukprot:3209431-Alexandrium_andersonii.AAC.1